MPTPIKGTSHPKKNQYYSFDCDENLHTHVKSKIERGYCNDFFFHFLHRKRVIHRKRK